MRNIDNIRGKCIHDMSNFIFGLLNGSQCKACPAMNLCWDKEGNKINVATYKNCLESIDAWLEQESIFGGKQQ
jgi:hypothetical protein